MRASLCRCGNRMVQDCIRVDVLLESTISTTHPFPQFYDVLQVGAREVSSGVQLSIFE